MADQLTLDLTAKVARDFKRPGTSSRAAAYAARYASGAFARIRTALLYGNFTADELAERTGLNLLTARPRCADLRNPRDSEGRKIPPFIVPTGETRSTASGQPADVLRLLSPAERRNWKR
ncbi:hypothetical protein UFOVP399_66 [uncultured Caudovirales phage]|uniref:Uncharacterized protein n=1 Tax=uncultured Caudovirales phage TaxID=2100421 RepID=A0A6J5M679_9CAUD|nr:hypothetical protein UFOVP399_66 [uncultured Caudovirales phage]